MKCFACDRKCKNPALAQTTDGQYVFIGTECLRLIKKAGSGGWQPPKGGPRLREIGKLTVQELDRIRCGIFKNKETVK